MVISFRQSVSRPNTLSDFKKLKSSYRRGKTPEQLKELHDNREANKIPSPPLSMIGFITGKTPLVYNENTINNIATIPINSSDLDTITRLYDRRKKNYTGLKSSFHPSVLKTNNLGQYSKKCKYTHYTYTIYIESWGYLVNKNNLYIRIDTNKGILSKVLKSPKGYHFKIDSNGIKLQSNKIKSLDYHFLYEDLIQLNYGIKPSQLFKNIITTAKYNHKARKSIALENKLKNIKSEQLQSFIDKLNEKTPVYVSIVDSIRVGNCLAGTINWTESVKIDSKTHQPITTIAQNVNRITKPRIIPVLYHAIERTKREDKQGYALLKDHYLDYPVN